MNPLAHKSSARPAIDAPEGDYVPPRPVIRKGAGEVIKKEPSAPMSADRFKSEIPVFCESGMIA